MRLRRNRASITLRRCPTVHNGEDDRVSMFQDTGEHLEVRFQTGSGEHVQVIPDRMWTVLNGYAKWSDSAVWRLGASLAASHEAQPDVASH